MKEFNVEAVCIPSMHYMVDISSKLEQIQELIEKGKYFTINRSRQYGKTTTLAALFRRLKDDYIVLRLSFEGLSEDAFVSSRVFVRNFVHLVAEHWEFMEYPEGLMVNWKDMSELQDDSYMDSFDVLSRKITNLCRKGNTNQKEILLFIDEVDKTSDNQIFLNFLGMLRNKYIKRQEGLDYTFKSVILAGVYDIKNLKLKIRSEEEKKYNSPWNVAADFNVDMSFSPKEIATMLKEYEADHHTGMDIEEISDALYFYTNGYPYLVSWLCKWIDEQGDKTWTKENIMRAEKMIHFSDSTLLDDLSKNYENNDKLKEMIISMLFEGEQYTYSQNDSIIKLGNLLGIFSNKAGNVAISNVIFENSLMGLVISEKERERKINVLYKSQFIKKGKLDMPHILTKFQEIMKAEYRTADGKFLEQQGRLLFLCFLKPIINGTGFYYVEPETRNNTRMDIVVTYGNEEHIIELKLWHGDQYRKDGIEQLEGYLDSRNNETGYLVSFSFNQNKEYTRGWLSEDETKKHIFEIVI